MSDWDFHDWVILITNVVIAVALLGLLNVAIDIRALLREVTSSPAILGGFL